MIFVYNLHTDTDDRSIWKLFGPFGAIINVSVVRNPDTKLCVGYGFVTMPHYEEAQSAIAALNGVVLNNRVIEIRFKENKNKVRKIF